MMYGFKQGTFSVPFLKPYIFFYLSLWIKDYMGLYMSYNIIWAHPINQGD